MGKNPTCAANTRSAVHNVRLDLAARAIGLSPSFGQSPFAIARGNRFEAGPSYDDAARLRAALERRACRPADSSGLLDFGLKSELRYENPLRRSGARGDGGLATSDCARPVLGGVHRGWTDDPHPEGRDPARGTADHRRGHSRRPRGNCKDHGRRDQGVPRPGRPHRSIQLPSARAQAGIYRHALEFAVDAVGLTDRLEVALHGFLVFTWPGSNSPAIRAGEDLTFQAVGAQRGFVRPDEVASSLVRDDDFSADNPALITRVVQADTDYREACLSFCDLAPVSPGGARR